MNLLSLGLSQIPRPELKESTLSIDTLIRRIEAIHETAAGITVTPENCMQSPTVHAIVSGCCRGVISAPVHVYRKIQSNGRTKKELHESHPVERLLNKPNEWQTKVDYWNDATSTLVRYGRYGAWIARGDTGPIRRLIPLQDHAFSLKQDEDWNVTVDITQPDGRTREEPFKRFHYARGPARDFLKGDSPGSDVREAIALEIAMEKYGSSFFSSPMPGIVFEFVEGFQGFKTDEERKNFVEEFQNTYRAKGRFRAALMPKGIKMVQSVGVENDKAQMIEGRKHQRTVICGAFGVPLYMAGDLDRQTFNNSEQQAINKVTEVILPLARIFEAAMERDLLTDDDRSSGVIIRFNLDGMLRGDFGSRQTGLDIQRRNGVINANDWRENENMNPISKEDGGDEYWRQGPSGQSGIPKPDTGGTNA